MYSYYQKVKAKLTAIQNTIDLLENNGNFKNIPDLLLLKEKRQQLKQDFYNEDISDNILKENFEKLENSIHTYLVENSL